MVDLITIIGSLVAIFIFYLFGSLMIREINEYIFRTEENIFHKSSMISTALSFLVLVQFFISGVYVLNVIIIVMMVLVLWIMIAKLYKVSFLRSLLITIACLLGYAIFLAIVAFLVTL